MSSSEITPKYRQEEGLGQELEELMNSLVKEKGWISSDLYQYEGFWYHLRFLRGVISFQKHFQVQDSDIFLVTAPKSGTTWLKAIMFSLLNRKQYPVMADDHPLLAENPHDLVPLLELDLFAESEIPDIPSSPSPRLFATHTPYVSLPESVKKSSTCKIVYLCRDPKDSLVSLWHFENKMVPKEMSSDSIGDGVVEMFSSGVSPFGSFWDHALDYWKQSKENPSKFFFLKYEDMKDQSALHLRRLAHFLECPFSESEEELGAVEQILKLCSFDHLSGLQVNKNGMRECGVQKKLFFRRGQVGDWKNHLSPHMAQKIDLITHQKFQPSGLII